MYLNFSDRLETTTTASEVIFTDAVPYTSGRYRCGVTPRVGTSSGPTVYAEAIAGEGIPTYTPAVSAPSLRSVTQLTGMTATFDLRLSDAPDAAPVTGVVECTNTVGAPNIFATTPEQFLGFRVGVTYRCVA
jgi:hypothetical protein